MSLLTHLLSVAVATNPPAMAVSNEIQQSTGISITVPNPNDPAEAELHKLMVDDDAAMAEVDKWIRDNQAFAGAGAPESKDELNKRIRARLDLVRKGYEDFLQRNPDSARGYLAYGTFLDDIGEEDLAVDQFEKSTHRDPKNPAAWNNLANYHGHAGPITNAFVEYAKAIELDPTEPVYYQNLATTVYLFRKDAREFYGITEAEVFDKSLALYRKALQLSPDNFPLASDYAQSYYGIRPLRTNDALVSWTNALAIAHDDVEREGVYLHLARIKMSIGRYDEARVHLASVTNSMYDVLKQRLEHRLNESEHPTTNSIVETVTNNVIVESNLVAVATNRVVPETNSIPATTNARSP